MTGHSFESILRSAQTGGWAEIENGLDPDISRRVALKAELAEQDARMIAEAWAAFAATPGGRKALDLLFDTTLRRTTYFVDLGQDAMAMATWGAFREGQNALAQEIARQIAKGQGDRD